MIDLLVVVLAAPLVLSQAEESKPTRLVLDTYEELDRTQKRDGRWKAPRKTPEKLSDAGVTGLAVLSFLRGGHTHKHGKFRENVAKATAYLSKQMDEKGRVKGSFPNQALVSHALIELSAVSRDEEIREIAQRALKGLLSRQNEDGSFGKQKSGRIYATTLAILAMKEAKMAGMNVDRAANRSAAGSLLDRIDETSLEPKGDPSLLDRRGARAAVFMGRLFSGVYKSEDLQVRLAESFARGGYPAKNAREAYFVVAASFQQGGSDWEDLLKAQDGWMASGKRSRDLASRLFEVLALTLRLRWDRAHPPEKGEG